jgi:hypothetical protein
MAYTPPTSENVDFELIAYTEPDYNEVDFELEEKIKSSSNFFLFFD